MLTSRWMTLAGRTREGLIKPLRRTVIALACATLTAVPALAADAAALRGYNAAVEESSISGI